MFGIEHKVAHTARRAGLLSGGLLLCMVGVAFLTIAGWIALYPLIGILNTALVFAGIYMGIGLIMIGAGASRSSKAAQEAERTRTEHAATTAPPIFEAFMYGLQAGARADRARR